jgi:ketosteroid isomerase-like protein
MSQRFALPFRAPRLALAALISAALFGSGAAFADEYAEITRLLRAGQANEANAAVDKLLAAKPRDPQLRFLKGVIQSEQNKPNDAVNTFTRLTEDFPELPEPYNNLAVLYAAQNQFDKARAALEMAIRTNPSYATAHENLGDVYAKLASQAYSKALQLDANNQGVQPKLNLIRDLFTPGKSPRVAAAPPAQTAVRPGPTPTPTPAAAPVAAAPATPTAPTAATTAPRPGPAPLALAAPTPAGRSDVETAVRNWAAAWAAKDMPKYLAAYGKDFDPPGDASRAKWEADRTSRITGKRSIHVGISDLQINVSGDKATARFKQDYKADALAVQSRKVLELARSGNQWVIVRESTGG